MEKTSKCKKQNIIGWIAVILCFLVIAAANYITVFVTDDIWYGTNLVTGEKIASVSDIVQSQIWHYMNWGGRTVAHTMLQFMLWGGRVFADICNVVCCAFLSYLMCRYAKAVTFKNVLLAIGIMFAINTQWFDTMLWQSGAANYLYTTTLIMLFVLAYLSHMKTEIDPKKNIWYDIFMIPLGLIAGWTNENMGPAIFILSITVVIYRYRNHFKVPLWMWLGSVFSLIGSAIMILAPGNSVRSAENAKEAVEGFLPWLWNTFLDRYTTIGVPTFDFQWKIIFLLLFTLILCRAVCIKLEAEDKVMLFTALLSYLAMWVTPHYPARATFGTIILVGCVVCRCFTRIEEARSDLRVLLLGITGYMDLTLVYMLVLYIFQLKKWV